MHVNLSSRSHVVSFVCPTTFVCDHCWLLALRVRLDVDLCENELGLTKKPGDTGFLVRQEQAGTSSVVEDGYLDHM